MYAHNAGKGDGEVRFVDLETVAETRQVARSLDWGIYSGHGGDGAKRKFGKVLADLVGDFVVDFPCGTIKFGVAPC